MTNPALAHDSVEKDHRLILDAVRRLNEGTWQLCDEDSDWANHLFPNVKEALLDHIKYEDTFVLPQLPAGQAKQHAMDHDGILALIWAIETASQHMNSDHFHSLLRLLFQAIDQHHHVFGGLVAELDQCDASCIGNKIITRAQRSSLEYK